MPRTALSLCLFAGLFTVQLEEGPQIAPDLVSMDTVFVEAEDLNKPPPPVEDVSELYSNRALDLLYGAKTVKADMMRPRMASNYRIWGPVTFARELCQFPVDEEGRNLTFAEIDTLTAMILNPDYYERVIYPCGLTPEFAFTFTTWNDTASVFICTSCLYVYFCDGEEWLGTGTLREPQRPRFRKFAEAIWAGVEHTEGK